MAFVVLTHGGAASDRAQEDGTMAAARRAMDLLHGGASALDAAVEACAALEDDPRFNAGTGSNLRLDGKTIEMDASCMDASGRFGAVAALRQVRNPVRVARAVLDTPHVLLAGEGATRFARRLGHAPWDPWTMRAQSKFDLLREGLRASKIDPADFPWDPATLERCWNYDVPLRDVLGTQDTVGAVVWDGRTHAAALSTGGTLSTLMGRVGDVPLPGCGLDVGPAGAVAVTGHGDELARVRLASRAHRMLEEGAGPDDVVQRAIRLCPPEVDVGVILVQGERFAGGSNRNMAWSALKEAPR